MKGKIFASGATAILLLLVIAAPAISSGTGDAKGPDCADIETHLVGLTEGSEPDELYNQSGGLLGNPGTPDTVRVVVSLVADACATGVTYGVNLLTQEGAAIAPEATTQSISGNQITFDLSVARDAYDVVCAEAFTHVDGAKKAADYSPDRRGPHQSTDACSDDTGATKYG